MTAAVELLEWAMVHCLHERSNRRVGLGHGEEPAISQRGQHGLLDQEHVALDFGLVFRPPDSGGDDRDPVVRGEVRVRAVEFGVVVVGVRDRALEVIGDHDGREALEVGERVLVRGDEVRHVLATAGLAVGVAARVQGGDEHGRLADFTG